MAQDRPGGLIVPAESDVDTRFRRALQAAGGPDLDLDEGIPRAGVYIDPRLGRGCQRWPEGQHLLDATTGQLVDGRCRATNLCRYCRALYVIETIEMLCLDAAEHAPSLWLVLTAREHLSRAELSTHITRIRPHLRARWPEIEWFQQVEFQRRGALHVNLLVKGVPVWERRELEGEAIARWCTRVDAEPVGQWSGEISAAEGLYRYLQKTLSHGLKAEQAPPIGWRGHRTSQTRGYLVRPASVMREEARSSLRGKRALAKAIAAGFRGLDAEAQVAEAERRHSAAAWRLFHARRPKVTPNDGDSLTPGSELVLDAWANALDADVERLDAAS